jgi:hypothetical protein
VEPAPLDAAALLVDMMIKTADVMTIIKRLIFLLLRITSARR